MRSRAMALANVCTIASWPINSAKVCGRYLRASTRYGAAGGDASGRPRLSPGSSGASTGSAESDIAALSRDGRTACRSLINETDADLMPPSGALAEVQIRKQLHAAPPVPGCGIG